MRKTNLISLVQACTGLEENTRSQYLLNFKIKLREAEISDLESFIEQLQLLGYDNSIFSDYYLGYIIPQIGKEFDLLRIGKSSIVNVELKQTFNEDKITKQLIRNQYYLKFLERELSLFTYVSDIKKIYSLDEHKSLIEVSIEAVTDALITQEIEITHDINTLFNPTRYLVSPFNSTKEFINSNYFLNQRQEQIKNEILERLESTSGSYFSIRGKAGTGKTLLIYDIAKELIEKGQSVVIIHCANLNSGQYELLEEPNWEINPIKLWHSIDYSKYDLVIIDETQRVQPGQLLCILQEIHEHGCNCIFSYDMQQWLRNAELINNIESLIERETSSKLYTLTDKIRTNKEIASFISALFDKSKAIQQIDKSNIELTYFNKLDDAKQFMTELMEAGWKIVNYTPSSVTRYFYENYAIDHQDSTHGVLGQEFDNVVAVIDNSFEYDENNELTTRSSKYYNHEKMLFQIMTRARKKISIIILDNQEILVRCLEILNSN